jgi:hypothetical protein
MLVLVAMYDVTSRDSWRQAVRLVERWRGLERTHGPRVMVVVGTKLDRLDDGKADRAVPLVRGKDDGGDGGGWGMPVLV